MEEPLPANGKPVPMAPVEEAPVPDEVVKAPEPVAAPEDAAPAPEPAAPAPEPAVPAAPAPPAANPMATAPDAALLAEPCLPPPVTLKRGEVIMTLQDAKKKKLPKGFAYEPVLPPGAAPAAAVVESPIVDGKRARKATARAIEAVSLTKKRGEGGLAKTPSSLSEARTPLTTPGPQPSTSGASVDAAEKARKKEEKRRLKEELMRIRAMQEQAEQKEGAFSSTPAPAPPSTHRSHTPYTPAPPSSLHLPPSSVEMGPDGRAKRTPKANQFYTSGVEGDFLTGNAKIPGSVPGTKSKGKVKTLKKPSGKGNPREEKRRQVEKDRTFRLERLFHHCASVLRNVESRNRNACLFLEPVDANLVPDYYTIVKKPMDFLTIKKRIEEKCYENPLEFAVDVRQVFANCKLYNKPDSVEANMGLDVEQDFERRFINSKIAEKWEQELMRRDTEEHEIANTPTTAPQTPHASKTPHAKHGSKAGGASTNKKRPYARREADEGTRPMTFEEKRALSTALEQLPADKLGRVVEIIQESDALADDDKEELELDIDLLDPVTLWKLQRYANGCLKPAKKIRKQAPSMTPHDPYVDVPQGPADDGPESSSGSDSSTSSG